jgi:zinc transport system permease protein
VEPFVVRALLAGIGLAVVAAPLGCLVVWRRMSYFGSTVAHAGLLGVALGIAMSLDPTVGVVAVSLAIAGLLVVLQRQQVLPVDSLLGLLSHASLAAGLVAASLLSGQRLDLMGYLFGDIFAVAPVDLAWVGVGGGLLLAGLFRLWPTLIAGAVHSELAKAEGHGTDRAEAIFMFLLAFAVALTMKIVGILLVIAFLIMPAAAARPFARTPEAMAALAALIGAAGTVAGVLASLTYDVPGGPAIVLVLSLFCFASLATTLRRA